MSDADTYQVGLNLLNKNALVVAGEVFASRAER